ncbi:MAG: potassium transporter Kup [Rhodocyclaceae bacterium]|nr:potassium transporter Kup [Rhodocyclaceae bacterium]
MQQKKGRTAALAVAALGVVYGDIGTSPLYTMKEIFGGEHYPVPITPGNILGMLSVIFWSLIVVISVKYVLFIMRADNKGEGGIMALMALVLRGLENRPGLASFLMMLGLFGAALFYGDSVLTPAISVLSAVEGLEVATPAFKPYIVPIALGVLAALFVVQKHGTARVGGLFGPIIVVWFATLGLLGVLQIGHHPMVLAALDPRHAAGFFLADPVHAFFSLGAAVLALTGGEALYADMGHFGRKPVQYAWFGIVLPGLVLNYFGQGALLLADPAAVQNPFYLMAPAWALYPMVGLSTVATVIASQAVISGAYSMTQQAIQLGYVPRFEIQHTSQQEIGQIYLPGINWALLVAVAVLVVGFGSSTRLAAAYGIAVTGTMVITTILSFVVVRNVWRWGLPLSLGVVGFFLAVDLAYFSSNLTKMHQGGWFPLALGLLVFIVMTTWKRGRQLLTARLSESYLSMGDFITSIDNYDVPRVPGTAVFLTPSPEVAPHALLHSLKHYKCLHERIVVVSVQVFDVPMVPDIDRVEVKQLGADVWRVIVQYGFKEEPDIPAALASCKDAGLEIDMMEASFFLGRETLIPRLDSEMAFWREKLFVAMFRNAGSAASYFKLPPNRVVELGAQIVL